MNDKHIFKDNFVGTTVPMEKKIELLRIAQFWNIKIQS